MSKYRVIKHWVDGEPIDQNDFDTLEEMLQIPMIQEQTQKCNFGRLGWQTWYCMPSGMPHYSSWDLMVEFTDGSNERICGINTTDGNCDRDAIEKLGLLEVPQKSYQPM